MAVVGLTNVTKCFSSRRDSVLAVDDLSLTVADGEWVVLLGPSGCGKTTTLRLVAGLEHVSSGTIAIGGRFVTDVSPKDRDVAMVFQDYALYPHMKVRDNLAFGLKMRRTPRLEISERVAEVASLLEIEDLLDRRPHTLSGGQRQRVAFGRAIVRRPAVCLFDEPLANLDARLRVRMRQELRRLRREVGLTALYVTHDPYEALAIGDRVVVMKDGGVQQVGRPEDVFDRPTNRFVAGAFGSPPMNFVNGRLVSVDGHWLFECAGERLQLPSRLVDGVADRVNGVTVLGVRPERVSLVSTGRASGACETFSIRVTMSELMGDHRNVYGCLSDGQSVVAKVPVSAGSVADGDCVRAAIDVSGVALFESGPCGLNVTADADAFDDRGC